MELERVFQGWQAAGVSLVLCAVSLADSARAESSTPGPSPASIAVPAATPAHGPPVGSVATSKVGQSEIVNVVYGDGLAMEQGQFILPFRGESPSKVSLLVFNSTNVRLTGLTVETLLVKQPGGTPVTFGSPAEVLRPEATAAEQEVPATGKPVSFTPMLAAFANPGTYTAIVRVQAIESADKPPRSVVASLTLVSPPAELNDAELNNVTIEVTRHWPVEGWLPWSSPRTTRLILSETGGKRDLTQAATTVGMIYRGNTADQAGGKFVGSGSLEVRQALLARVAAGNSVDLLVTPKDFDATGVFYTKLGIISTSLNSGRVEIPLQVRVSDGLLWPLVVIALGTIGGFAVNNLLQQMRPRELNRYTMAGYSADLQELERTAEGDNLTKISDLKARLADAAFRNSLGDFDAVKTALTGIEADLNQFKADKAQQKTGAGTDLDSLCRHINSYKGQPGLVSDADSARLNADAGKLDAAERLLNVGQVDEAVKQIAAVKPDVSEVFKAALKQWTSQLTAIATGQDALAAFSARLATVSAKLNKNDPSDDDLDAARNELETIAADMQAASSAAASGPHFARANVTGLLDTLTTLHRPPVRAHRPHIEIAGQPEGWVINTPMTFQIVPPLASQKTVEWIIQEQPEPLTDMTLEQVFTDSGEHTVSARIKGGGKGVVQISRIFYVQPGKSERIQEKVRRSLKFGEIALTVVSLILATLSGLIYLYSGKPFGTWGDYVLALFWGFGLDSTVRGYTNVLLKLRGGSTPGS